jgi:hypothetical protein
MILSFSWEEGLEGGLGTTVPNDDDVNAVDDDVVDNDDNTFSG